MNDTSGTQVLEVLCSWLALLSLGRWLGDGRLV